MNSPTNGSVSEPLSPLQTIPSSPQGCPKKSSNDDSKIGSIKRLKTKSSTYVFRIRDHVKLGIKLSETVKGKLKLGARIVQEGGRENIFKHIFGIKEREELLKASQCYLSTTAGPIAGLLFISTQKVAFCSERPITFRSSTGELLRTAYKVVIPVSKVKRVQQSEDVDKPQKKYIKVVTEDDFEFWFMGFLRYEKAFRNLERAMSMASSVC